MKKFVIRHTCFPLNGDSLSQVQETVNQPHTQSSLDVVVLADTFCASLSRQGWSRREWALGTATSHIGVPSFQSQLCFLLQLPDNVHYQR